MRSIIYLKNPTPPKFLPELRLMDLPETFGSAGFVTPEKDTTELVESYSANARIEPGRGGVAAMAISIC
jgi:hypothetical protein